MHAIFMAQWHQMIRSPWAVLIMMAMSVVMALVFGTDATSLLKVTVLPDASLTSVQLHDWLEQLGTSAVFEFEAGDENTTLARLGRGSSDLALRLGQDSWRVLSAGTNENAPALAQFVARIYREELALQAAAGSEPIEVLRTRIQESLGTPALSIDATSVASADADGFAFNSRVQGAVGMSLFFAMFTILAGVNNILEERRTGLWDRVIVSPVSKAGMYGAHMLFTFLTGMIQLLLLFAVFRFGFGITMGGSILPLLMVLAAFVTAITSLGMLLVGLVGNVQQMAVVIPIVAVSSAMIGGAYWPIEIVNSPVLLALSNIVPLRHAMEALKGLAYHGWGLTEVTPAVGVLLGFAIVFGVLGIWRAETR